METEGKLDINYSEIVYEPRFITPEWLESKGYTCQGKEWISGDGILIITRVDKEWYLNVDSDFLQTLGGIRIREVWKYHELLKLLGI